MNIDKEMMENQEVNLPYEQPSLKKYGTMKEFTLNSRGSKGDAMGSADPPDNISDPEVRIENQPTFNTPFGDTGSPDSPDIDQSPITTIRDSGIGNNAGSDAFD